MLNRRHLRVRAMQALYSYQQAKGANYELGLDLIAENFLPDLNSMEVQDKKKLEGSKKLAQTFYTEKVRDIKPDEDEEIPFEIKRVIDRAFDLYTKRNKKDHEWYNEDSLVAAEQVYKIYLLILQFFIDLSDKAEKEEKTSNIQSRLHQNKIIVSLKHNQRLKSLLIRFGVNWDNEQSLISRIYKEAIKNNTHYLEYCKITNRTAEDDLGILKYLLKNVIFKHELPLEFFDRYDLYFVDDMDVLRTMVTHSLQAYLVGQEVKIEELDDIWNESKQFLKTLFNKTIENDKELESLLTSNLKNWELDRIAQTDSILLKMGLIELMNFPSIPVKVTINEIIDIAKDYSTNQSGKFINGILDKLSKELVDNGKIEKSGRGVLDNK